MLLKGASGNLTAIKDCLVGRPEVWLLFSVHKGATSPPGALLDRLGDEHVKVLHSALRSFNN